MARKKKSASLTNPPLDKPIKVRLDARTVVTLNGGKKSLPYWMSKYPKLEVIG